MFYLALCHSSPIHFSDFKKAAKISGSPNFNTLFRLGIVSLLAFRLGKKHSLVSKILKIVKVSQNRFLDFLKFNYYLGDTSTKLFDLLTKLAKYH